MPPVAHFPLSAFMLLVLCTTALPAGANCLETVASLERELQQLQAQAPESPVRVETEDGTRELDAEEGGTEPQENWFGSPSSLEAAEQNLETARQLGLDGEEESCLSYVDEVRAILAGAATD